MKFIPIETNKKRISSRNEILAFQRLGKRVAKCFDDFRRIGLVSVVDGQRFAAIARWLFDRRVRFADAESVCRRELDNKKEVVMEVSNKNIRWKVDSSNLFSFSHYQVGANGVWRIPMHRR